MQAEIGPGWSSQKMAAMGGKSWAVLSLAGNPGRQEDAQTSEEFRSSLIAPLIQPDAFLLQRVFPD